MAKLRQVIIAVEGHVDHGKTSILDRIRGTSVVTGEAGKITQAIGASIIPLPTIQKICGPLLQTLNMEFTVPGLLFIDTPGHAAFTALRKRGGNLADTAIVVIDINEGIMPQTQEAIEILKTYKTPFIIAANKIDLIPGFQHKEGKPIVQAITEQEPKVQAQVETKMYELVGKIHELGFESERFDRVQDYAKQIAIVPTSADSGDGIPELLMVMTGLAQKYLESGLKCDTEGQAKGIILELKEEKGLGTTVDVILYDGNLKRNDLVVIGSLTEPVVTKVRALLEPAPLAEMREQKAKFKPVQSVTAATGVKIAAPQLENATAGMPLLSATQETVEEAKVEVQKEVQEVLIQTETSGVIVKADTLGSLEAVDKLLKEKNVQIRKATIGNISKKDISEAESIYEKDPFKAVVLGFNVHISPDALELAKKTKAKIITDAVIYKLIEDFEKWREEEKKRQEAKQLDVLVRACKVRIMPGYVFRQSNPAVFGVDVLGGVLKVAAPMMKADGSRLSEVKGIQQEQENIEKAERGKQVALSMGKVTVGRQINEGDILYSDIPEEDFRKLKGLKKNLSKEEITLLKEIAAIKRKENAVWGI
ncbi:translation initiation factor IF-2 [Candidatus Woesearchaeota archaeon]|nr:translation initiation factor IF-2 [Candidatus Woesearchaeota archaeon]